MTSKMIVQLLEVLLDKNSELTSMQKVALKLALDYVEKHCA